MVNVAHNNYNGISQFKILLAVLGLVDNSLLDGNNYFLLNLCTEFGRNDFSRVVVDNLVCGYHHTQSKELLDNLSRLHLK